MPRLALPLPLAAALACLTAGAARAQPPAPADSLDLRSAALLLAEYRADLTSVRGNIVDLAKAIPADKYAWRPAAGVRSVAEVLLHTAGEWYYICPISNGGKPPADFDPPREAMGKLERRTADKAAVLAELDRAWAHCAATFDAADPARLRGRFEPAKMSLARAALRVAGDLHEHLGQLIAYARSVGVTPPWSK